ncbi:alpha/beta-hydrolase [Xylona heveae TC161]|uniref:Alpha/beta-hydrolase n=1 Tax=Xylona heveae (strain CBS 132557 / TC161) TaxID=1328760 RepID=A0A165AFX3_XYLHT|nr:alpha/beta-hydrolase [Xylona heveae TC161]KZF20410.1 alpha/beta-hydrolase [Xylona heveae TC161]
MPGRLPSVSDFPSSVTASVTPPPASHPPTNILLLLHGLGDTNASFTALGRNLNLPETACVSLQAPMPLPFELGGFHWGDDILFDESSMRMEFDTGFTRSTRLIADEVIRRVLIDKCGYRPREIVIFGFGQGGMAALAATRSLLPSPSSSTSSSSVSDNELKELGGIISIGGPLPASTTTSISSSPAAAVKSRTPVLLCGGSSQTLVTASALSRTKDAFEFVEYTRWRKVGDSMPGNREEMLPIMQFFARRLRSRRGVPPGSVELG